jgi:hypothetical protein
MREVLLIAGVALTLATTIPPAFGSRHHRLRVASEARVEQAQGNMPASAKSIGLEKTKRGAPEGGGGSGNVTSGSPSAPVTCNQQNASSPACYSATQQARPVGR